MGSMDDLQIGAGSQRDHDVEEVQRGNILDKAKLIVEGARQNSYGPPEDNFRVIGEKWGITLGIVRDLKIGDPIPPRIVALMMIDLKTCRDAFQSKEDNLVDICGYAYCASNF
jgi:hypothetical protein